MKTINAAFIALALLLVSIPDLASATESSKGSKKSKAGGGKGGKGKGGSKGGCDSGKGKGKGGKVRPKDVMTMEAKCAVFKAYVNSEHNAVQDNDDNRRRLFPINDNDDDGDTVGGDLCEAFDPVDPFVCPTRNRAAKICAEPRPDNNKAVKERYCIPLFRDMCDEEERDECTRRCIQYVSKAQGNCCDIECD